MSEKRAEQKRAEQTNVNVRSVVFSVVCSLLKLMSWTKSKSINLIGATTSGNYDALSIMCIVRTEERIAAMPVCGSDFWKIIRQIKKKRRKKHATETLNDAIFLRIKPKKRRGKWLFVLKYHQSRNDSENAHNS